MKTLWILALLFYTTFASDYIDVYTAYTNGQEVIIEGRIIDEEDKKKKKDSLFKSFLNNEKKEIALHININDQNYTVSTDKEGYFSFEIKISNKIHINTKVQLQTDENSSLRTIQLYQPSMEKHIGIISDFDDTIIVSNVTNKLKLLYNTFFQNYKERKIIVEVKNKILALHQANRNSALFFITGSPHQFLFNINNFLDYHHFPKRVLLTKKIHGSNSDELLASVAYKYNKIVKLIKMYPKITWVLFGDSGEKDKESYLKVRKNYPNKIEAIYIRDIQTNKLLQLQ